MFVENTTELAQNKLLLLYLINTSEKTLYNKNITEFLLEKDYMNYFLVQQYLSELSDTGMIEVTTVESDKVYSITEKGKTTLLYFEDRISEEFKKDVKNNFTKSKEEKKHETEVFSESYQKDNGQYVVNIKLIENENTLFSLYIDVPDKEQADKISDHWKNETDSVYMDILNILTNNSLK